VLNTPFPSFPVPCHSAFAYLLIIIICLLIKNSVL
jgi:hypothetical protein